VSACTRQVAGIRAAAAARAHPTRSTVMSGLMGRAPIRAYQESILRRFLRELRRKEAWMAASSTIASTSRRRSPDASAAYLRYARTMRCLMVAR
jgi:hypothetical protein